MLRIKSKFRKGWIWTIASVYLWCNIHRYCFISSKSSRYEMSVGPTTEIILFNLKWGWMFNSLLKVLLFICENRGTYLKRREIWGAIRIGFQFWLKVRFCRHPQGLSLGSDQGLEWIKILVKDVMMWGTDRAFVKTRISHLRIFTSVLCRNLQNPKRA